MVGKQLGFSDYEFTTAKKQTKREKFLAEMEVVPSAECRRGTASVAALALLPA
jgi:hypothetical protein